MYIHVITGLVFFCMSIYEILIFCIAESNIKVTKKSSLWIYQFVHLEKREKRASMEDSFSLLCIIMYMIISHVIHSFTGNTNNPQIDPVPNMWLCTVPLLVEHHTGIAEVIHVNPLEALNFSKTSFSNNNYLPKLEKP